MRFRLHELVTDEKGKLSTARLGLWLTISSALAVMGLDTYAAIFVGTKPPVPNTVYALLGTMFTAFAAMVGGPRMAQYLAPQVGSVASGIASAVRDMRLPSRDDDERSGGNS